MERGYTDLFPTQKQWKINNPPLFRLSERLQEDRILCRNTVPLMTVGTTQPPPVTGIFFKERARSPVFGV